MLRAADGVPHEMSLISEPRTVCARCRRPERVCYCRHLTSIDTVTRVVLLQHPRERDVAIGTARMASLCLPNSELHVGVSWEGSAELDRALSDPARPAVLLYPGEGARNVSTHPPSGPVTLVVVDGTWWQARKLVRQNPRLAALPRYAFVPLAPTEYRIRKEPQETYVSTIEALVHVLSVLEGDAARFEALLVPFRAMIDAQIEHQRRLHGARARHAKKRDRGPWHPHLPAVLRERPEDLVCVIGEANAWPCNAITKRPAHPDELVQWLACRPSTGEVFEAFAAPSYPLGPNTSTHTRLPVERILSGGTVSDVLSRWEAFARPDDVWCTWGHYAASLFARSGGPLPGQRLDLRVLTRAFLQNKVGQLEDAAERLEAWCETPHDMQRSLRSCPRGVGTPRASPVGRGGACLPVMGKDEEAGVFEENTSLLGELGTAPVLGAGRGGVRLGQLLHLTRRLVEVASTPRIQARPASGDSP